MPKEYTEADIAYREAQLKVVAQLKAAGLKAAVTEAEMSKRFTIVVTHEGHKHVFTNREKATGYSFRSTYTFAGIQCRFDYMGRRGMGTISYPLRKDGTIDAERLKGDLESFARREAWRTEAADQKASNVRELAPAFANVKKLADKLTGPAGASVFIDVDNDGSTPGRIKFKVSGHISPARAAAILAAVNETKEL